MSFGYSIGDGILLVQLAWKTVQGAIQACGEHDELTREVSSLHRVLQRLHRELSNPNSLLNQADKERREELEELGDGCERILNVMNSIVTKYNMLSDKDRKGKRIWQKVKFGNGEMKDLAEIRLKLSAHTSALIMSLNLCSLGSQSRVEKQLNGVGGDLEGIRTKVEWIAANMTAKNGDYTVWTSYTNDDKSFWRELRRELVREGYQSSVIHKHKHLLKEYVEELGSRGAFDHISDEENPGNDTEEEASLKSTYPGGFSSGDAVAEDTKPEISPSDDARSGASDSSVSGSEGEDTDFEIAPSERITSNSVCSTNSGSEMSDSEDSENDEASPPRLEVETDSEAPSDAVKQGLPYQEAAFEKSARHPLPIQVEYTVDEENLPKSYLSAGSPQAAQEVSEWHKSETSSLPKQTSSRNTEPLRRFSATPTSGLHLPETRPECSICLDSEIPRSRSAKLKCGHRICHPCLKVMFRLSVIDKQLMPPKCCTNDYIPLKHVESLFDMAFKKTLDKKHREFTTRNPIYCPSYRCGEWIKPGNIRKKHDLGGRMLGKCSRCKTKVCVLCRKKWHGTRDCSEDEDTKVLLAIAQQAGWRQCYQCKTLIELKEGNNHVVCRCLAQFCMACGLRWKSCSCLLCNTGFEDNVEADRLNHLQVPEEVHEEQAQRPHRLRRPRLSNSSADTRRKDRRRQELAENDSVPHLRGLTTQQDYLDGYDPGPEFFSRGYQPESAAPRFGLGYIGISAGQRYSVTYSKLPRQKAQGIPQPREQQPTADCGYRISPLTDSRASLDHRD